MKDKIRLFNEYVKQYDLKTKELMGKYHHTFRVIENMKALANSIHLSDDDIYLASVIALYHDIARFKQWSTYHTFDDSKSFDHGLVGKEILEDGSFLSDLKDEDKNIILNSVLYHNKLEVPNMNEKMNLFMNLIREADQLDIIKEQGRMVEDYVLNENLVCCIYKMEIGNNDDVKVDGDRILLMLSWVLNFKFSYSYLFLEKYHILDNKFHLLELYSDTLEVEKLKKFIFENIERRKKLC
jgi:HD superfamily phosphohydrolase YqeK